MMDGTSVVAQIGGLHHESHHQWRQSGIEAETMPALLRRTVGGVFRYE